jgi:hypothetical protein
MMGSLLLLLLLPLLVSGVRVGGGVRLGGNGGGYEDWRLGTATYIKESQGHPLNDGMRSSVSCLFAVSRMDINNVLRSFSLFCPPFSAFFFWMEIGGGECCMLGNTSGAADPA